MEVHLGGHLAFYDRQKRSRFEVHLDAETPLLEVIRMLGVPEAEIAVAAVNRAQTAIKTYPDAPANEEALFIMVKAYDLLGMNDLRDDALKVLKHNFPNSPYLTSEGKLPEKTWWKFW